METVFLVDRIEFFEEATAIIFNEWGRTDAGGSISRTRQKMRHFLNSDRLPLTVVGIQGKELIGLYSLMLSDRANTRQLSPWLGTLFVKAEHRERSNGSRLIEHALQTARKTGAGVLFLHTTDRQSLYARAGFRPIYETEVSSRLVTVMSRSTLPIQSKKGR